MAMKRQVIDRLLALALALPLRALKQIRFSLPQFPVTRALLRKLGVFLVIDHYYEPLIDTRHLADMDQPRDLPGIDFDREGQAELLVQLAKAAAPDLLGSADANRLGFRLDNGFFEHGDADLWFRMLCHHKPRRIVEVGCGHSTKVAMLAIEQLERDEPGYHCDHVCIDPYPAPWLAGLGIELVQSPIEQCDEALFGKLESGDILFIDTSHIIRPQGDVLTIYLRLLPRLAPGVIVHIHDIFLPRDYPAEWVHEQQYFWNEQYLLEAFLSHNRDWQVMLATNMMMHEQPELMAGASPFLDCQRPPRSLYMRRRV